MYNVCKALHQLTGAHADKCTQAASKACSPAFRGRSTFKQPDLYWLVLLKDENDQVLPSQQVLVKGFARKYSFQKPQQIHLPNVVMFKDIAL